MAAVVIAWGLGVCSTAMAAMSALGDLPPVDLVLNCDPGWERERSYVMRAWYTSWLGGKGVRVESLPTGNVREQAVDQHMHIPLWTDTGGPLQRQCTGRYKTRPAKRRGRELLGYHATKPPHPRPGALEQWIGFTLDEWHRMKDSRVRFIVNRFPLVERKITRGDCVDYLEELDLPVPVRSACACCPYRRPSEWMAIRDAEPRTWQDLLAFDEQIRTAAAGLDGSSASALFVYKAGGQARPLAEADLEADAARERTVEWFQLPLLCGDGACWT